MQSNDSAMTVNLAQKRAKANGEARPASTLPRRQDRFSLRGRSI